jgi:YihY family inner membrane protein
MNPLERVVRSVDRAQQRFGPAAFVFGVVKKFGDDRAGSLAALIAYYGFLSLFPLLLLLVTILGIVAGHNPSFAKSVEHSALSQFPVIGNQLGNNIHALHRNSTIGLVIGILGLIWGAQGAIQAGQYAMAEVWNVPGVVRPNFWSRLVRTLLMMGVLGVFLVASTTLAGIVSFATKGSSITHVAGVIVSLLLNVALYVVAFRVLTPKQVRSRLLVPGAILGGAGWTVLQYLGVSLIDHTLRHTSQVYGFFAVVLGLVAWMYLGAQMTLYVAEVNVVKANRFWPRGMVQPPLTEADERVLVAIGQQGKRRPEQRLSVKFHREPLNGAATVAVPSPDEGRPHLDPGVAATERGSGLRPDPDARGPAEEHTDDDGPLAG